LAEIAGQCNANFGAQLFRAGDLNVSTMFVDQNITANSKTQTGAPNSVLVVKNGLNT